MYNGNFDNLFQINLFLSNTHFKIVKYGKPGDL